MVTNWTSGAFTYNETNVDGTGVDFTGTVTGETGQITTIVGASFNGVSGVDLRSNGFTTGATFTFTFSKPITSVTFDIAHINTSAGAGDKFTISGTDGSSNTIVPTVIENDPDNTFTTTTNATNVVLDAIVSGGSTFGNANISFSDPDGITSITILWEDCSICTGGFHGSAIGDMQFCFNPCDASVSGFADADGDNVADVCDLDDDNDGILDTDELCPSGATTITESTINVYIDLGAFENENSWTLTGPGGFSQSGGPYLDGDDIIDLDFTVTNSGTYVFTLSDTAGDGLDSSGGSNENATSLYRISLDGSTVFESGTFPVFGSGASAAVVNVPVTLPRTLDYVCLTADPTLDSDNDGILNYQDADYAAENGSSLNANGVISSLDTDGDGIIDSLDTDSDNDGCFDALEAAGSYNYTQLTSGAFTGVDSNGVPTTVGASGQATTAAVTDDTDSTTCCDASVSGFTDTDGDNIVNICDVDDDNDGLLDTVECSGSTSFMQFLGLSSTPQNYSISDTNITQSATGTVDLVNTDNNGNLALGSNGASTSVTVSKNSNFTISAATNAARDFDSGDQWTLTSTSSSFIVTDPSNNLNIISNVGSTIVFSTSGGMNPTGWSIQIDNVSNLTLTMNFGNPYSDLNVSVTVPCSDYDNDGIQDYLDTDSDNDGCPDAIEGDGAIVDTSLLVDLVGGSVGGSIQNLGSSSDAEGNPIVSGSGFEQGSTVALLDNSISIACTVDLSLTKRVSSALPKVGDSIVYTITVKNSGLLNATSVNVTDLIPAGLTYGGVYTASQGSYDAGTNVWTIGTINIGETKTLDITVTVSNSGTIINTAEITQSNQTDIDSTPNNGN